MSSELEAEAKLRSNCGSHTADISPDEDNEFSGVSKEDATGKGRHGPLWRPSAHCLLALFCNRWADALGLSMMWGPTIWGWIRVTGVMLYPEDDLFVRVMGPLFRFVWFAFVLSWIGIVFHGPGRVPPGETSSGLPSKVKDVLQIGQLSLRKPWDGSDGWCTTCSAWKPPMAHHCRQCDRCTMFMDHHCNFVGTCIGFRNARCYIVFLHWGKILTTCTFLSSVRWYYLHPPTDSWDCLHLMPWFGIVIVYPFMNIRSQLNTILRTIKTGWTHLVMQEKFDALLWDCHQLDEELNEFMLSHSALNEAKVQTLSASRELKAARKNVLLDGVGPVQGIFFDLNGEGLRYIFGEPRSWRWFLPLRPGGHGDPLHFDIYVTEACAKWVELADVWKRTRQTLQTQRAATLEFQERIQNLMSDVSLNSI